MRGEARRSRISNCEKLMAKTTKKEKKKLVSAPHFPFMRKRKEEGDV